MKFVNLHAHSTFSIGDATGFPKEHFDFVIKNSGEDSMAMALSDHGNANGFGYIAAAQKDYKNKGIKFKPLYGVEFYLYPDLDKWRLAKEGKETEEQTTDLVVENEEESKLKWNDPIKKRHHLVVLAINQQGLTNLFRLVSYSYRHGFYRYPRVDFKLLEKYNEGLVISTACVAGLPAYTTFQNKELSLDERMVAYNNDVKPLLDIFGKERAYLELQFNKLDEQKIVNLDIIEFAKRSGYKLVVTADSHYPDPKQWRDRELYRLLARQAKNMDKDKSLPQTIDELKCELFPKSGEQMFQEYQAHFKSAFDDDKLIQEAIERTHDIAWNLAEFVEPDAKPKLPNFGSDNPFEDLKKLVIEGMNSRSLNKLPEYVERIVFELKVIKDKDFAKYFLTLKEALDVIRTKMLTGPARGSGAGSLVCYVLGITQIDPIKYGLLFERFISLNRKELPDVDSDCENKEQAMQVLKQRFGNENVLSISNYNTLQLKSLVKDISKFYNIPFTEVNSVTAVMEKEARNHILEEIGHDQKLYQFTFEKAKQYSPTFKKFLDDHPNVGTHIENLFRQIKAIGKHAGGVVIVNDSEGCMPVIRIRGEDQVPFIQGLTASHAEQFGLVKYDFLGVSTIKIIRRCIELILKSQQKDYSIQSVWDYYNTTLHPDIINTSDDKVFSTVYRAGRFPGIFQFTETAAQNFCKRASPKKVDDIAAITSIFRPGPLKGGVDKQYVSAVHGENDIQYEHPVLKEVLGDTYGYIVYQEQFMLLANKLAGFSLDEADKLRKVLVKPMQDLKGELIEQRKKDGEKFIAGCIANGLSKERAERLWDKEILGFISYGFNKSHAIAYAFISYQCAWLLTYFEKEWVRAYLETDIDRDKAIADVESIGYKILPPDINNSNIDWEVADKNLYPSLLTVKGIGETAAEELIRLRKEMPNGRFESLDDLMFSIDEKGKKKWRWSKFNKKAFDALMKVSGFETVDSVGEGKLFENYRHMHNTIIGNFDKIKKGKSSLEELSKQSDKADWKKQEIIEFQTEILGTFNKNLLFDSDTLDLFRAHDIVPLSDISDYAQNIWFIVKEVKTATAKNNKKFFKLKISDIDDQSRTLNYFGNPPKEGFHPNQIYVGTLFLNDGYINTPFKKEIVKI